ncbi:MAG: class I SAM-dependent methyltransferase [Clostridiales bacterium]|nr:class I SAM-dependent methyltransferase [Clostridiales bacterium]
MYESLSALYDVYMEDVPYEKWFKNIVYILKKYGQNGKRLLDLGCGTGTMAVMFSEAGYDVTGIDLSEDMLAEAKQKSEEKGAEVFLAVRI